MKRAPVLLVLVSSSALAGPMITPPRDWELDPEQSAHVAKTLGELPMFGGRPPATIAGQMYFPSNNNAAMVVSRATLRGPSAELAIAARAELDAFLDEPRRNALTSPKVHVVAETRGTDGNAYVATQTWADETADLVSTRRIVLVEDADQLVMVAGECLTSSATPPELLPPCAKALSTLDPGIAPAQRIAFVLGDAAAAVAPAPAPAPTPDPDLTGRAPRLRPDPARLDDGSRVVLPPMSIPQDKPAADRRPVYIGAGLVVLAAVFYWNRRRRERFERDEARPTSSNPPATPSSGDDDADDLHAAAAAATEPDPKDDA